MSQVDALLLSIAIEALAAAALIGALRWGRPLLGALAATAGTLVSHWPAWMAMDLGLVPLPYPSSLLVIEIAVVLIEAPAYVLIARQPLLRALILSTLANGASAGAGLLIVALDW